MSRDNDRRIGDRIPLYRQATLSDGVIETPASSLNASSSGIALRSDWTWPRGSRVSVRIALGASKSAVARAVVCRSNDDVMGLELLACGPAFSKLLRRSD